MDPQLLSLRQVAETIGATVEGDDTLVVCGLAPLDEAGPEDLTFAADARRAGQLTASAAGAAIVGPDVPADASKVLLRVADVDAAVAALLASLAGPEDLPPVGIDPSASVSESAQVAPDARIGPGVRVGDGAVIGTGTAMCHDVTIGTNVRVGADCVLCEGVRIRRDCTIGDRVRIGPNSVIGYDGFGYYNRDGVHHRIVHAGTVDIGDDVEIGACSCVDRAKFGATVIGAGTKIDNLVQVAHNVQVGPGSILVGQCGIAGSARLGRYVVIGGNAGVRDNIRLGDGARLAAYSAASADVAPGATVAGTPAMDAREMFRIAAAWRKLPDLLKQLRDMDKRLRELESPTDHM